MVTVTNVAQQILDENNYETTDIHATAATALTRVEYLIDNATDYINLEAGTSIADLSGGAGTKSLTCTAGELPVVKLLSALMVRAYLDKGPAVGAGGLNVATTLSDPQYRLFSQIVKQGIKRLCGRAFERT